MKTSYSTYEAKAKFSEILRKVRAGQSVTISYHGREIAEIRPITPEPLSLEASLMRMEEKGILAPAATSTPQLVPLRKKPGALKRFLETRE